jgi:hypothetical protein
MRSALGCLRASEPPRVPLRERTRNGSRDERGLRVRVRLPSREFGGEVVRRELPLEVRILASHVAACTQVVAKRQRPPFLVSAGPHYVHVVSMRPHGRTMEEGAKAVVWVRHVNVPQLHQAGCVRMERLKAAYGNLDVNDRLRGKARNGGRAVVFDPQRDRTQGGGDLITLRCERARPGGVVGHDLEFSSRLAPLLLPAAHPTGAGPFPSLVTKLVGCASRCPRPH